MNSERTKGVRSGQPVVLSDSRETFTVRKQSFGVGVERTFPLHSPKIEKLEVASRGRVRRAKLYYLRGRVGKAARVAERRWGIDEEMVSVSEEGAVDASGEGLAVEEEPPAAESGAAEGETPEAADVAEGQEADGSAADETPAAEAAAEAPAEAESADETPADEAAAEDELPAEAEASGESDEAAEADAGDGTSQEGEQDEKDEA